MRRHKHPRRVRKHSQSLPPTHPHAVLLQRIIASILLGLTFFLLSSPRIVASIGQYQSRRNTVQSQTPPAPETKFPPTAIRIPKLNKILPIQAALIKDNEWDLFTSAIAWLSTSAAPGEGNVILYGHNWWSLFGDLYKLTPGDTIEVQQNNTWKVYIVTESKAIQSTDVDAVFSKENQLTLYTCEGSFDQKRRVVYAKPQS